MPQMFVDPTRLVNGIVSIIVGASATTRSFRKRNNAGYIVRILSDEEGYVFLQLERAVQRTQRW
jgi:hypothetical protein